MRLFLRLVILLGVVWAAVWLVAARSAERAVETWFAEAERDGWIAGYDALETGGFPLRVALSLERARLVAPATGAGWEAPALRLSAAAWAPGLVRIAAPPPQRLWLSGGPVEVQGALSARVRPGWLGGAQGAELAGQGLTLEGAGWRIGLDGLDAAAGLADGEGWLDATVRGVALDPAWLPDAAADRIDQVRVAARAGLTADPSGGLRITALRLGETELAWGETRLAASGALDFDASGLPEGRITFRAVAWGPLIDLAVAAGWVQPEVAPTWVRVFETLQAASGAADELELPLVFRGGRMSLGPIPLGPAPRLLPAGI